jgi:hypothetical protein
MPMPRKLSILALKKAMGKINKMRRRFKPNKGLKGVNKNLSGTDRMYLAFHTNRKGNLNVKQRKRAARRDRRYGDETPMDYGSDMQVWEGNY